MWLFCSTITALLAFKRPTQSLEKLMDVMKEKLPNTMADVRISEMEISDLMVELSVLGCHYHFKAFIAKSVSVWFKCDVHDWYWLL
ncbi:hypothetical protein ACE6H2_026767 [Prunus campanulata]